MSRLAKWSVPARWVLALALAALCFGVLGGGFALLLLDWRFVPLVVVLPVLIAPLESLLLTPLYTLTGRFRYFSPMLFATRRRDGGLDLHAGTLFDLAPPRISSVSAQCAALGSRCDSRPRAWWGTSCWRG
jgi:hypothetical protein